MKRFVLGLSVLFAAMTVNAQTDDQAPQRDPAAAPRSSVAPTSPPPQATAESAPSSGSRGSSRLNREGKSVLLVVQPIGIGPITFLTQGLGAGLYLNPDSILQLEFKANSDDDYEGDNYSTKVRSLGVNWKQFLGNSFYLKGGLEHRWIDASSDYTNNGFGGWKWGFKGQSTSAAIALGNQWQFSGFTLGCDWVGIQQPLFHTRSGEYAIDTDDFAQRRLNEESSNYLEETTISLVHFYLGASF